MCQQEERFLFPVYPMICLAGAIAVDVVQKLYFYLRTKFNSSHISCHYLQFTTHITVLAILICGLLGFSRSLAIYKGSISYIFYNILCIIKTFYLNNK